MLVSVNRMELSQCAEYVKLLRLLLKPYEFFVIPGIFSCPACSKFWYRGMGKNSAIQTQRNNNPLYKILFKLVIVRTQQPI